jgi:exopolysaccharide biosynthesis glucuronosyltransferase PssE
VIFVTTGNFDTGFDRLVRAVDRLFAEGVLTGKGLAQIAGGSYEPSHLRWQRMLLPAEYDQAMLEATLIIAHGGAGTVRAAAALGKPIIVMPRRAAKKEHYNDHQVATCAIYEQKGLALVAQDETELPGLVTAAGDFVPNPPSDGGKVVQLVRSFLNDLAAKRA